MYRFYIYTIALISITTMPVSAFAEIAADSVTADTQSHNRHHIVNAEGLYIDLPSVDYNHLIEDIRRSQAYSMRQEQQIIKYLDENQLDTKDALLAAIMPGGLLYAAVRKSNLEQAKSKLAEITEVVDELSYDLLAMQSMVNTLTVAQLH
jgi:hypothetical protein